RRQARAAPRRNSPPPPPYRPLEMSSRRARREHATRLADRPREDRRAPRKARIRGVGEFLRAYTAGLKGRDIKRLFDREAASAYSVLTREHAHLPEPKSRRKRLLFRARLAFLGLSYKLTPARRAVFA